MRFKEGHSVQQPHKKTTTKKLRCAFSVHARIKGRSNRHHVNQRLNCSQISQLDSVYTNNQIYSQKVCVCLVLFGVIMTVHFKVCHLVYLNVASGSLTCRVQGRAGSGTWSFYVIGFKVKALKLSLRMVSVLSDPNLQKNDSEAMRGKVIHIAICFSR